MKKILSIFLMFLTVTICLTPSYVQADEIENLTQRIKNCNDRPCLEKMELEAEKINDAAAGSFSNDFAALGNDITVNHCGSILDELFYHMEMIRPYSNFTNVFYLKKLKKLTENKERLVQQEINNATFEKIKKNIENTYNKDMLQAQNFVDYKVVRMKELCGIFRQNLESVRTSMVTKGSEIPESLKEKILHMKQAKIWKEFETGTPEGENIRQAILLSSNHAGKELLTCMGSMFSGLSSKSKGRVFSNRLVEKIEKKAN